MNIPYGYCHCGCGVKTNIVRRNDSTKGLLKGEPRKFIRGHTTKNKIREKSKSWKGGVSVNYMGYPRILMPSHPRANSGNGYVFEHILKAEKALGKYIGLSHPIHHYTLEQLVVCEDNAYHKFLHQRQRAYEVCGHANWRKCTICKQYDKPENLHPGRKKSPYHQDCKAEKDKERYFKRMMKAEYGF